MPFDKLVNKVKKLANDSTIKEKLSSDKAERISDSILDKAAGAADSLTKGKHSDSIRRARDAADRAVGSDHRDTDRDRAESRDTDGGRTDDLGEERRDDEPPRR